VLALVAGMLTITATVAPAPDADAATVNLGTIQAQMANHRGVDNGTANNCIRYSPATGTGATATSSALVTAPNQAVTAHGRPGSNANTCPTNLNTETQSAVGFQPSNVSSVADGTVFLIGRMTHYNNPVYSDDRYYTGDLNARLTGFTPTATLTFNWRMDETPNQGAGNCCDDTLQFTNQIADVTLTQGGLTFKLVMLGFVGAGASTTCPAAPSGSVQNLFTTVEGAQTNACLYAKIVQLRSLRIVKNVVGSPPTTPSFAFSSTSALAGSAWDAAAFNLNNGGTKTADLTSGDTVTVTETDPSDDRWSLSGLTCQQFNAAGQLVDMPGTTNLAARKVTLTNVPAPLYANDPSITCTYTNTYTAKTTLTLVKQVQGAVVSPTLWTLTATGFSPPAIGTVISGPSGSAAVTNQRIVAGTYQLTELGTGAAETGFVQVGTWACAAGGTTYPVSPVGIVQLPDLAVGTTVTCTVVNRQATGSLQIRKQVDDPQGGYIGGGSKTFSGTYNCGSGSTGTFSALTTSTPVTISNIPAGRSCTVTENPPTGGLLNASFAWGTPSYSAQPVTITDQGTAVVTITNPVVQRFGTFALTKVVSGPGGYTGGTGRVFPVAYTCTLTNGPTSSGTLNVTTAQAVSPAAPIPVGSVCTFSETLTTQPGDFADPSYVWVPPSTVSPASITVADGTTAAVTVTNSYARETGQLVIAKLIDGDGYIGTGEPFTVHYNCGVVSGSVALADGGSKTVTVPARNTCRVDEEPPSEDLLSPAFDWGQPTWNPGPTATIPANDSVTLTVTNPTIAVFGRVQITKAISGEVPGVTGGATFDVLATCDNGSSYPFTVGPGGSGVTPDLPVGTSCDITETAPTGGLIDSSYAWGTATIAPTTVTITEPGQVVTATVTNPVVRVRGSLTITKRLTDPDGVVAPGRTFAIAYTCLYGSDTPVSGVVNLAADGTATVPDLLLGSNCAVAEEPTTLNDPPAAGDSSYVWLAPTYSPGNSVTVTSAATPASVTVTNTVDQLEGTFRLTKTVTGAGKDAGYDGGSFTFTVLCTREGVTEIDETVSLADTESWTPDNEVPLGTACLITETARPDPTSPAYGWDPVQFTAGLGRAQSNITIQIDDTTVPVQVNAVNPITPRFGSVSVSKTVTGETAGLADGATFAVTLNCGPGLVYHLTIADGGSQTQDNVPAGSTCVAIEAPPDQSNLVNDSYAWGPPTYDPADATVDVAVGETAAIAVTNPIVRVTAPVRVVKTLAGAQGVVDPDRTYPVTWSCTLGSETSGGTVDVTADPAGVQVSDDVPVGSACTATEGDLGQPSTDPAYRWEDPVITGVTVTQNGTNTVTVANTLTRDSGTVLVRKRVTGATAGYVNLGDATAEDFTLHGSCSVPADPSIPTRYADGTIADRGEVPITASIGWTCAGSEDSPGQDLLVDPSYAWAAPTLVWGPASDTDPPSPTPENTGSFVLTRAEPTIAFWAVNPIVRVSSTFTISKNVVDPFGVVPDDTTFTGAFSCVYGDDDPVTGTWSLTNGGSFTGPAVYLNSVCTVTEDALGDNGLPDASFVWDEPQISDPVTVVAGGTATVTVTNTLHRQYGGLQVTKVLDDPAGGVPAGTEFTGAWSCALGDTPYSGRFTVGANDSTTVFTAADQRVPATAICTITEDTLNPDDLVDGSFGWGEPAYEPADVTLAAGQTAELTVTNTVHRVYSAVEVRKVVSGPGSDLVPTDRPFTGELICRYGNDNPVLNSWSAATSAAWVQGGILVGSVCRATEDLPGATGQPVSGDSSYTWDPPQVSGPVTVGAPTETNPVITVTNPIVRQFGRFFLTKRVTGAVEGIVDRTAPYPMTYSCQPGTGPAITGTAELTEDETITVGPGLQFPVEIPIGSVCTMAEPLGTMPPLRDSSWTWESPTFTLEGLSGEPEPVTQACADPVEPPCLGDRSVVVSVPPPQEDIPEPTVGMVITNPVLREFGSWTATKTSDPASGAVVIPGQTVTYSVTVDSTGDVPVHDVVVTDDLSAVLPHATMGTVTAPAGTTATVDTAEQRLVWTVGTVPNGESRTLTYQVTVNRGATGITIGNVITADGDTPPETCAAPMGLRAATALVAPAGDPGCSTSHVTPRPPTITKAADGDPVYDPATGYWTVGYRIDVRNPNADIAVPYTLSDTIVFPTEVQIRSASVVKAPTGVTPADPAWNGGSQPVIATGVSLPGGATHTYRISVVTSVPAGLSGDALACASGVNGVGFGYFNSAGLSVFGESADATNCQPIPVVLAVDKHWVINGVDYADGSQPVDFSATLTLDDVDATWGTAYAGYPAGTSVKIGETASYPGGCTSTATGYGPTRLDQQLTAVTVTNVVTCSQPVPPPEPLPNTGFPLLPFLGWGVGLLVAGALLLGGAGLRRGRQLRR
jgi:uncharacterized repeat protein (TIGR01451 family)